MHGSEVDRSNLATYRASLRRDGFMSVYAGNVVGSVLTEWIWVSGKFMFINVETKAEGWLKVKVHGHQAKSALQSYAVTADSTCHMVQWQHAAAGFFAQVIKIEFTFTNVHLYAFWFTNHANGTTNGDLHCNYN